MAPEKMKQVAVRMYPRSQAAAVKMAKREHLSFGEFVRQAVDEKVDVLNQYIAQPKPSKRNRV
jgi:predicted HicB family RNase H-like nuclease